MAEIARRGFSDAGRFYAWVVRQERKHELVDGEPVMMPGANRRHDRVVTNALRIIGNQLRGKACQPFTSDTYIRIPGRWYKTVPSLQYVLHIDTDGRQARLYWREEDGIWLSERVVGLGASINMPGLEISLALSELFEGLTFRPKLLEGENGMGATGIEPVTPAV